MSLCVLHIPSLSPAVYLHTVSKRSVADEASKLRDIVIKAKDVPNTAK